MSSSGIKRRVRLALGEGTSARLAGAYRSAIGGRSLRQVVTRPHEITVYCEQPSHWQNVELVVQHLLACRPRLKIQLLATYSLHDYPEAKYPAGLKVQFDVPHSALPALKTHLLYTPLVGMPKALRPKDARVVHSLVSLTSLDGVYSSEMFDGYDYILCAGPHHIQDFQRWRQRNTELEGKTLIPAGYPKLDLIISDMDGLPPTAANPFTVVYAPTHAYAVNADLASLRDHGEEIVESLLAAGHRVIFRPHPVSFRDTDQAIVQRITERFSANEGFELDRSKNYIATYSRANVMVTDVSGTGFTYSLSLLRPSVFFASNASAEVGLTGIQYEDREAIGGLVRSAMDLVRVIEEFKSLDLSRQIMGYRDRAVFNVGSSPVYVAEALLTLLSDQTSDTWVTL